MKDPYVKTYVKATSIGENTMKANETITHIHIEIDHNLVELIKDEGLEVVSLKLKCEVLDIDMSAVSKKLEKSLPNRVVDTILEDFETAIYKASVMEKLKTMIR